MIAANQKETKEPTSNLNIMCSVVPSLLLFLVFTFV